MKLMRTNYIYAVLIAGMCMGVPSVFGANVRNDLETSLGNLEKNQKMMDDRLNTYRKAITEIESKILINPPKSLPFPPTHPDTVHVNISDMTVQLASDVIKKEDASTSVIDLSANEEKHIKKSTEINNNNAISVMVKPAPGIVERSMKMQKYVLYIIMTGLIASFFALFYVMRLYKKPKKLIKIKNEKKRKTDSLYEAFVQKFEVSIQRSKLMKASGVPESLIESLSKTAFGRWVSGVESAQDRHEIAMAFAQSTYPSLGKKYQNMQSLQLLFSAAIVVLTHDDEDETKGIAN